ncbi:MBL fold metallo-hydrolase [Actinoplanes teichomyceticus]|uniref:L-ascorbate metabolism protein UlaG (Beta-lactamase superfamily) n=1 Tax=Actinoplanes teichomyceticus TaxID=1867 RepID=A0A561WPL9_ACTTI|nr:MBL fold metallo-hydrolase [Actinoplanes teichomyceticus]TWG25810.1 L-ascorbate metabolism protein UlaG (beta-lactamase superfamily) [Actinoplanes teichomyceticus]GIF10885.1 MBL fold metallo-hydrolase [Actinoplanes teichomyceticus]
MRVTKFTHACLRIEGAGVLVVDPGEFTEKSVLDGADAVVVTHEHFDHLDVAAVVAAVTRRPELRIFAHADVLAKLGEVAAATTAVAPGDEFEAAGFRLRAYGGRHAVIHPDIPRIANLGYLIADEGTNVYHPGDSFVVPEGATVDTLCVPLNAPWMKVAEAIDFARAVRPGRAFAVHDGLLNERGAAISDRHLENFSGTRYQHLAPGDTLD